VAERVGLAYLDTGAMYRALAFEAMRRGIDPADADPVAELARDIDLRVGDTVVVDGVDATIEIRSPEVTRAVSTVAANPAVRKEMVVRQREWVDAHSGGVVEGRDIGTVVFPHADVKVYLTADDRERASRRSKEMLDLHYDQVAADIARRDHIDSTRPASPLSMAADAVPIDTTGRDIEAVVEQVLALVTAAQHETDEKPGA
jgi:cytidylate kinase